MGWNNMQKRISLRNVQNMLVFIPYWMTEPKTPGVKADRMRSPHLCHFQDAIHGWLPSLPLQGNEVPIKTGQVKRNQADHGQPQQQHVASFPSLERNGTTKGFYFIFCNMKCREHRQLPGSKELSKMSKRKIPRGVPWNSRGHRTTSDPKQQNSNKINGSSPSIRNLNTLVCFPKENCTFPFSCFFLSVPPLTNIANISMFFSFISYLLLSWMYWNNFRRKKEAFQALKLYTYSSQVSELTLYF